VSQGKAFSQEKTLFERKSGSGRENSGTSRKEGMTVTLQGKDTWRKGGVLRGGRRNTEISLYARGGRKK